MILQSLVELYEKLVEKGEIGPPGWCRAKVSYAINIDKDGNFRGLQSLMTEDLRGKKSILIPPIHIVPLQSTRSGKMPPPYFLCDNARYLLGLWVDNGNEAENTLNLEKAKTYYQSAAECHRKILRNSNHPMAKSICLFFEKWDFNRDKEKIDYDLDDVAHATNLVFRFWDTAEYIHQNPEIQEIWNQEYNSNSASDMGQCLITGERLPLARLHPLLRGFPGAQSSGAALVSFNAPAYESYEKEQGMNAPVSEYAANAYGEALRYLLSEEAYHKKMGDTMVFYWAKTAEEGYSDFFGACLYNDEDDEIKLMNIMNMLTHGEPCKYDECIMQPDTKFYVLGLSPNAARLSVRFFYQNNFGMLMKNVNAHYERLKLVRPSFEKREHPSVGQILFETVNKNSQNKVPSPVLVGNFLSSIINNTRYPATIFQGIMLRIRAEKYVNRNRAAMIKAYLLNNRPEMKEAITDMELNEKTKNVPYVLGRMFAILEYIQEEASPGINSTIHDRYFNSACATPSVVFPQLLKLKNSHMRILRRTRIGLAIKLDKQLGELFDLVDASLQAHLSLEEQGIFIIGYYHQTQKRYIKKEEE